MTGDTGVHDPASGHDQGAEPIDVVPCRHPGAIDMVLRRAPKPDVVHLHPAERDWLCAAVMSGRWESLREQP